MGVDEHFVSFPLKPSLIEGLAFHHYLIGTVANIHQHHLLSKDCHLQIFKFFPQHLIKTSHHF